MNIFSGPYCEICKQPVTITEHRRRDVGVNRVSWSHEVDSDHDVHMIFYKKHKAKK